MPLKVKCPTCRKEAEWENNRHRPFCSDRCQLIDLAKWTEERYRISHQPMKHDSREFIENAMKKSTLGISRLGTVK